MSLPVDTTVPDPTTYPFAPQSFNPSDILETVGLRIIGQIPAMRDRCKEWDADTRPVVEGESLITYRIADISPQKDAAASKRATPCMWSIDVTVWTRKGLDQTGDHCRWNRAHWPVVTAVISSLHGEMLGSSYVGPGGQRLSKWGTTSLIQFNAVKSNVKAADRQDWGVSILRFELPSTLPTMMNPVS